MKCFDAHSDIWTDVTIRRLKGETNVFHNHHFERLQKGDINRLADHCEHMIDVMGIDHVGCGFDFCGFLGDPDDPEVYSGMDALTRGIEDASRIPHFFDILRDRGMREDEIEKIAFGNFQRIVKEVVGKNI